MDDTSHLTNLGSQKTEYHTSNPSSDMLETFPNRYPNRGYSVSHKTKEFTSRCPKTGQPDFAELLISYTPKDKCVETKSLKLYLFAYRNEGSFMETIANHILDDLVKVTDPTDCHVLMTFTPRGGIETTVETSYYHD